jgi:Arc/MetJ-type ribon-helix-helix transcriptional regulator
MSTTTTTRRRWTEESIESELRAQVAELGHFPTRPELVARGLRGLWDAMRVNGGVEAWQERLAAQQSTNGPEVSHQQIAALAYSFYERGVPGDPISHWLTAERELMSSHSDN